MAVMIKRAVQVVFINTKTRIFHGPAYPKRFYTRQPGLLKCTGGIQSLGIVKPEAYPVLKVLGGPIFTLWG
ncbi:hypothetical protein [Vreelandella populi]|uniref:hypothetical protein n=1 Tax=Vreelandella populi TaxID=2498858 RepID=UPI001F3C74EA|nr:hypothetical protein [Halomonas populi]